MVHKNKSLPKKSLFPVLLAVFCFGVVGLTKASAFFQDEQDNLNFNLYKGEVVDSQTKTPLVFATLTLEDSNISTVTNTEGQFSLKVPKDITNGNVIVSFLGYKTASVALSDLQGDRNRIPLTVLVTELTEISLAAPKDATNLVRETLKRKGENYFNNPTLMTGFYRETIKRRKRNVSLSEAVVNIYKSPYDSERKDAVQLYKARKSTDYSKLDTLTLKLQGGPFNALFVDIMKYPEYIFSDEGISNYVFTFENSTRVNDRLIYIVNFKQLEGIDEPLYKGQLFIDAENKILTSAIYSLNITNRDKAAQMFVRKKPANARVWPTDVAYRVDYREKNGKWFYGYSNVLMEFRINWSDRLFNSTYSMSCEMAITDWEQNVAGTNPKLKDRLRSTIILEDAAIGFTDPDFWGEYNIIEPEKSIESAIKKIQRQLKRTNSLNEESASIMP